MDSCNESLPLSAMTLLDRGQLHFSEKFVTRTMKCLPDKFVELCHMHLAFLLDLSGDKLELLLSSPPKKRKSGLVSVGMFRKKDKPHAGLFGLPLTDEGVCLMIPLVKFLKMERNISKEGLFRKPGNKSRMITLKDCLVAQGSAVNIDPEVYSSYDVACVLKEFLRELPEPLLTERHLEAHKQILALGQHASSPEEKAWYTSKKLSALQLLMLLLPPPAQKLTSHLTRLLQRIADSPDTKMTTATLGTIFAPIFFIDRKVEPSELCSQIAGTSPGVSFMIENAHDLFHAPRELVADLASYWSALGQTATTSGNESSQMKKSLSGRTVYTGVCYTDRKLSQREDVTSNTQAELASLFAHVQSLPDTPHNARLKKQIIKATTTPVMSSKKNRRSKSITASIKKRLPSLRRLRHKREDLPCTSSSSASSTDSKIAAPFIRDLHQSPVCPIERKLSQRPLRPGHKRLYTADSDDISAVAICTPPKQKCRDAELHKTSTSTNENVILTGSEEHNTENMDPDTTSFPKQSVSPLPLPRAKITLMQSETKIAYLPHNAEKQISAPVTSTINSPMTLSISSPVTLSISSPVTLSISAPMTPNISAPVTPIISAPVTPIIDKEHATKTHPQPFRKQGTPIMQRAVLRIVQSNSPDSSF